MENQHQQGLHCFNCGNSIVPPPRLHHNKWMFECPNCGEVTEITPTPDDLDGEAYDKLAKQWGKIYGENIR